jgi:anti-sigma factor RsiW
MTSKTRTFSDEDLTAFLDGEAEMGLSQAIEDAQAADPVLRQRLEELGTAFDALPRAFKPLLNAAPDMPDLPKARNAYPMRAAPSLMMASLVLGVGLGFLLTNRNGPSSTDWMQSVAEYQVLYVPETLTSVAQSTARQAADLARLGGVLDLDLGPAQDGDTLTFKRGQLLGFEGQSLVQLAYLAPGEVPVALCIIDLGELADTNVVATRMLGMSAAHWQRGKHAFLLIGGQDDALIKDAAERFAAIL